MEVRTDTVKMKGNETSGSTAVDSGTYEAVSLSAYVVSFTLFFIVTCAIVFAIKRRQSHRQPVMRASPLPPRSQLAIISRVEGGVQFSTQSGVMFTTTTAQTFSPHPAIPTPPTLTPPPYSSIAFDNHALDVPPECDPPPPYSERDIAARLPPTERKDNS